MSINILLLGILTLCCFLFVMIQSRRNYLESYEDLNKGMKVKSQEYFEEMPVASASVAPTPVVSGDVAESTEKVVEKTKIPAVSEEHKKSVEATEKIKQVQGFMSYVKEKFMNDRNETPVIPSNNTNTTTDSIIQGFQMHSSANPGCDMDPRYIRKDSIPCYNCTLK